MVKQYSQLYLDARRALLTTEDVQTASLYARNLLSHVSGKTQEQILAARDLYASEEVCDAVEAAVARLLEGEPLAYVLGEWDFYGLRLEVNRNVLIPRDDTCAVTELAINNALFMDQAPRILDLCTGSGCIGLAIASRVKDARVTLADISREALAVAKRNVVSTHMGGRVSCIQVDALKPAPAVLGKFDLIVSNPPYVTAEEMETLPHSVLAYEPHLALLGGDDGLDFYRAITENFKAALKDGGLLCYEFGEDQGDGVCRILEQNGFTVIERTTDFNGTERAAIARYDRKED